MESATRPSSMAPTLRNSDDVGSADASKFISPNEKSSLDTPPAMPGIIENEIGSKETDVLEVDWDGPDDPQNPRNWSIKRKWAATVIVSAFALVSTVSSTMIAPASAQVAQEFGITNNVLIASTTSIFVLAYAFGPLFLGPMSEMYGRSVVLQCSSLFYLAWNLGCGFAKTDGQLIAFRLLAGFGGSAPLTLGAGVLGDCWHPVQRGQALAIYSLAPLLGPAIGPITGAWIAEKSTWRWVFWSTTIVDAVIQCFGFLYLDETYAPVLLERKAKKIRKADVESGYTRHVITIFHDSQLSWKALFKKSIIRPFALYAHEPIVQLLGFYMAFIYGVLYIFLTTMPDIFQGIYGQSSGISGLHYIALGLGISGASQLNTRLVDRMYVYLTRTRSLDGQGRPEFRLPSMVPGTILMPIGLLLAGWATEARVHWIAVDIGIALVGAGMILNFQTIQIYVVDAFTLHAASALAAVSCLRALCGFGFPLFAPSMYNALGYGVSNTILAVVSILVGCPAPWLFWKYGERIRKSSKYTADQ